MTTIFDILDKAGNINRPKSRNAGRYAKGKKVERKFGTKTPSDADIKARAASDRASRFAAAKLSRTAATNAGKKPKSPTATKQPKAKKQVKISGKFSKEGASRIASANANNSRANVAGETSASTVGRGDSYGGAARAVSRKKSVECRLWKAELNNTFNTYEAFNNQKRIIPCSVLLDGEYNQDDICIGVPCIIGKNGCEKIINLDLNDQEMIKFSQSAEAVRRMNLALKEN